MLAKIARWGNSLALRLPKNVLEALDLHEGDAVTLRAEDDRLVVQRAPRLEIETMIAAITPEMLPDEGFDVAPVGRELL